MNRSDACKDEETMYECLKHRIRMCASEAACKDPELYCKFRSACMIHFMEKEHARHNSDSDGIDENRHERFS